MNSDPDLLFISLDANVFLHSGGRLGDAWNQSESLLHPAWPIPGWLKHDSPAAVLQLVNLRDPRMKEDPIARPQWHRHLPDSNHPLITADDQRAVGTNGIQRIVRCFGTQDQGACGPGAIQDPVLKQSCRGQDVPHFLGGQLLGHYDRDAGVLLDEAYRLHQAQVAGLAGGSLAQAAAAFG